MQVMYYSTITKIKVGRESSNSCDQDMKFLPTNLEGVKKGKIWLEEAMMLEKRIQTTIGWINPNDKKTNLVKALCHNCEVFVYEMRKTNMGNPLSKENMVKGD